MRLNGIILVVVLALLTACGGNKGAQVAEEVPADSVLNDSLRNDSLQALVEDYPMPKAADELFADEERLEDRTLLHAPGLLHVALRQ